MAKYHTHSQGRGVQKGPILYHKIFQQPLSVQLLWTSRNAVMNHGANGMFRKGSILEVFSRTVAATLPLYQVLDWFVCNYRLIHCFKRERSLIFIFPFSTCGHYHSNVIHYCMMGCLPQFLSANKCIYSIIDLKKLISFL